MENEPAFHDKQMAVGSAARDVSLCQEPENPPLNTITGTARQITATTRNPVQARTRLFHPVWARPMRTPASSRSGAPAAADTTVRGVDIAAGESVYLAYVSGNRDEEVFTDPFRFDVGRNPNKHVAFGYGVHFCLGAALARMEMNSLFTELIPRLKSVELAGVPELSATTFVGGLKHLPIRYSLR